ncbi:MAG: hypothetical protein ILP16_09375 [Spirochaetales bacterium]|nr:hypothetical protein [Spirochaetales bacterium]
MPVKERSSFQRKVDHICRVIFLTEEGKPKSTLLIYSFSLALLFIVVFLVSYWLLLEPLEMALSGSSVVMRNIVEYTVPALVGCIPCVALSFAFKERMNMVPAAFTWLCVIDLIMFVTMIFMVDRSDWVTEYRLFLAIVGLPMLISAVLGTVASQVVYRRRKRSFDLRMEKYSPRR